MIPVTRMIKFRSVPKYIKSKIGYENYDIIYYGVFVKAFDKIDGKVANHTYRKVERVIL